MSKLTAACVWAVLMGSIVGQSFCYYKLNDKINKEVTALEESIEITDQAVLFMARKFSDEIGRHEQMLLEILEDNGGVSI